MGVSLEDLFRLVKELSDEQKKYLSSYQEEFLVKNPQAAKVLILILNGREKAEIKSHFGFRNEQLDKYLQLLQSHDFITESKEKVVLKYGVPKGPRPGGTLQKYMQQRYGQILPSVLKESLEMLNKQQKNQTKHLFGTGLNLTSKSIKNLRRELEELTKRYLDIEHYEYLLDEVKTPITMINLVKEYDLFYNVFDCETP